MNKHMDSNRHAAHMFIHSPAGFAITHSLHSYGCNPSNEENQNCYFSQKTVAVAVDYVDKRRGEVWSGE